MLEKATFCANARHNLSSSHTDTHTHSLSRAEAPTRAPRWQATPLLIFQQATAVIAAAVLPPFT